jgi:hypothetical protein
MRSRVIGPKVSMCDNDDDDLSTLKDPVEAHLSQRNPSGRGRDLRFMYEAFGSAGLVNSSQVRVADQIAREETRRLREVGRGD